MMSLGEIIPGDLSPDQIAFRILLELANDRVGAEGLPMTTQAREEILNNCASMSAHDSAAIHRDQVVKRFAAALETQQYEFGTAYCVIRVQDTGLSRAALESALSVIRSWLPNTNLDFLEIDNNSPYGHYETPMLTMLRSRIRKHDQ